MVEVISMWFNEAKLAPFFLGHYMFADKIHILLDSDTTDKSKDICSQYKNVEVEYFTFPDMMDDDLKVNKINEVAKDCSDWIINVDADEFVAHCDWENVEQDIVVVPLWEVFRNALEDDLDPFKPAYYQRRYGNVNKGVCFGYNLFNKPIAARRKINPIWTPGNHSLHGAGSKAIVAGTHWAMADVDIAIDRRIKGRKERQSKNNKNKQYTVQHWNITEDQIKKECEEHKNDPRLF